MRSLQTILLDDQYTHWSSSLGHVFGLGLDGETPIELTLIRVNRQEGGNKLYFKRDDCPTETVVVVSIARG